MEKSTHLSFALSGGLSAAIGKNERTNGEPRMPRNMLASFTQLMMPYPGELLQHRLKRLWTLYRWYWLGGVMAFIGSMAMFTGPLILKVQITFIFCRPGAELLLGNHQFRRTKLCRLPARPQQCQRTYSPYREGYRFGVWHAGTPACDNIYNSQLFLPWMFNWRYVAWRTHRCHL